MEEHHTVRRPEIEQIFREMLDENPKLMDNPYFRFRYNLFREFEDDRHRAPRPVILAQFGKHENVVSRNKDRIEDRSESEEE